MNVWYVNSILGTLRLEEEDDAIVRGTALSGRRAGTGTAAPQGLRDTPSTGNRGAAERILCRARREFDLPLAPKGTPFQKAVWAEMNKIPYGETRTYGQLAAALGRPKACRAVGGACHCNPIAILQPCHRVVGRSGKLTGYAYGVEMKQYLLELEQQE